jgi:hypothetical protein
VAKNIRKDISACAAAGTIQLRKASARAKLYSIA